MTLTGRMLAKTLNSARSFKSPCSGRTLALGSDHCGPPTAPRITASLSLQLDIVLAGKGSPVASIAAPPINCSLKLKLWPCRDAMTSRSSRPEFVTSGPIPSPGRSVIRASRSAPPQRIELCPHDFSSSRVDRFLRLDNVGQKHQLGTRRLCRPATSASTRRYQCQSRCRAC